MRRGQHLGKETVIADADIRLMEVAMAKAEIVTPVVVTLIAVACQPGLEMTLAAWRRWVVRQLR